ncbi:hypothetical protein LCGC14_2154330 [marine sediment metagenome]|uniref:Uncharacterized protein n=1 Tax=marine sediment metagenome TaxID=412755 RepID=A0A0F9DUI9_9ZZZZ
MIRYRGIKAIHFGPTPPGDVVVDYDATNHVLNFSKGLSFASATPAASALLFTGMTLPADSNVIRGVGIDPTSVSGWVKFTGEVTDTPAVVYLSSLNLHTKGLAEILGVGSFADMDSGASCKTLWAQQNIAFVSEGATVLTAAGAPSIGIFASWNRVAIDKATFDPGGVAAVQFLAFSANVTDVSAEDSSIWNVEISSGKIRSLIHLLTTGGAGATNLLEMADVEPVVEVGGFTDPNAVAPDKGIQVKIGSLYYMIPLYVAD